MCNRNADKMPDLIKSISPLMKSPDKSKLLIWKLYIVESRKIHQMIQDSIRVTQKM